jgi:cytidine deaminase
METKNLSLTYLHFDSFEDLTSEDQELVESAKEAMESSYSPYSKFSVGAAIRLANGIIVTGSNQENAAYPSGLCAERVAFFSAASQFPKVAIQSVAVVAKPHSAKKLVPVTPCGACRQVMAEYEMRQQLPIRIMMTGNKNTIQMFHQVSDLLPMMFHSQHLTHKE